MGATRQDAAQASRLEGIRLRAGLNVCVVTLNLLWTEAWREDRLEIDGVRRRIRELMDAVGDLRRRLDAARPASRADYELADPPYDERADVEGLRTALEPTVALLALATEELLQVAGENRPEDLVAALRARETSLAQALHGEGASRVYQASCIRARRYALLAAPGGVGDTGEEFSLWDVRPGPEQAGVLSPLGALALESRTAALEGLRTSTGASAAHQAWAARDPAFKVLLDEKDFQLALRPAGSGVDVPFRSPWVEAPRPVDPGGPPLLG